MCLLNISYTYYKQNHQVLMYTLCRIWHCSIRIVCCRHWRRNVRWIRCCRRSTVRYRHTTLMLHRIRQLWRRRCGDFRCWVYTRWTFRQRIDKYANRDALKSINVMDPYRCCDEMECSVSQRVRSGLNSWLNLLRVLPSQFFGRNRSQISCFEKPRVAIERNKLLRQLRRQSIIMRKSQYKCTCVKSL